VRESVGQTLFSSHHSGTHFQPVQQPWITLLDRRCKALSTKNFGSQDVRRLPNDGPPQRQRLRHSTPCIMTPFVWAVNQILNRPPQRIGLCKNCSVKSDNLDMRSVGLAKSAGSKL